MATEPVQVTPYFCIRFLRNLRGMTYVSMFDILNTWRKESEKLKGDEISKEEYDPWRYNYPTLEAERFKDKLTEH